MIYTYTKHPVLIGGEYLNITSNFLRAFEAQIDATKVKRDQFAHMMALEVCINP
jgi:hypothetical protein